MNLNLSANEGILLQKTGVCNGGFMSSYTGELYLTTINLIYINKGIFGNIKNIQKYPISQVKIVSDTPQVFCTKNAQYIYELQIHLKEQQLSFSFQTGGKREISKWVNEIIKLLNESNKKQNTSSKPINGAEIVATTIKDTIDTFKNTFATTVTQKCSGCGVSVSGKKGELVKCKYCDSETVLK